MDGASYLAADRLHEERERAGRERERERIERERARVEKDHSLLGLSRNTVCTCMYCPACERGKQMIETRRR